jgi:hypothetical protein
MFIGLGISLNVQPVAINHVEGVKRPDEITEKVEPPASDEQPEREPTQPSQLRRARALQAVA